MSRCWASLGSTRTTARVGTVFSSPLLHALLHAETLSTPVINCRRDRPLDQNSDDDSLRSDDSLLAELGVHDEDEHLAIELGLHHSDGDHDSDHDGRDADVQVCLCNSGRYRTVRIQSSRASAASFAAVSSVEAQVMGCIPSVQQPKFFSILNRSLFD